MADMTRVYVVERLPISQNPADNPTTANPNQGWLTVGQYDDPKAAGYHAASLQPTIGSLNNGIRVRQFWVESWPTVDNTKAHNARPGDATKTLPTEVPMVQYQCMEHQDQMAKAFDGGATPRCRVCRSHMVPEAFANAPLTDMEEV